MNLSEREWMVLCALWETGGAELGTLVQRLQPETGWSRNTVLTYLTRMEGKGLVAIDKTLTPHQYRAVPDQESCREQERKSFVERVYSGATGDLIAAFLKEEKITPAERERLQTLTASGVAALLLLLKALFQDKLPPKWQFAVWSVLALMLLLPAGYHGRYVLVHWQIPIEMLKAWCGDFGFTQVYFPLPFVKAIPTTVSGWLFVLYTAGVIFFAAKYMLSYISLRQLLRRGRTVQGERLARIEQIADAHDLKLCRVVEVSDLPSAFVCGILRPVLAIPARAEANSTTQDKAYAAERGESTDAMDEKVLLHELFHLKHRDTFWSALIFLLCFFYFCNLLLA